MAWEPLEVSSLNTVLLQNLKQLCNLVTPPSHYSSQAVLLAQGSKERCSPLCIWRSPKGIILSSSPSQPQSSNSPGSSGLTPTQETCPCQYPQRGRSANLSLTADLKQICDVSLIFYSYCLQTILPSRDTLGDMHI